MQAKDSLTTVLITGITGYVSQYLMLTAPKNVRLIGTSRKAFTSFSPPLKRVIPLDLNDNLFPQLEQFDEAVDVVLHTAAMSNLKACEQNPTLAERVNGQATKELAQWCQARGARLVYFSTDIVFKGDRPPYDEQALPDPINVYGKSKWQGELAIQEVDGNFAIGRIALALGRGLNGTRNFIDWFLDGLQKKMPLTLFTDEIRTPTYVYVLAERFWQLALSKEKGIFHVCGNEALDRFSLGKALCDYLGYGHDLLKPISLKDMNDYPRPADVSLVSTRTLNGEPFEIFSILKYIPFLLDVHGFTNFKSGNNQI